MLWALHGLYCPLLILLLYPGLCEHCTRSCHQEAIDFFWMLWVLYHPFLDAFCTAWGSITFWMLPVLYRKLAPSSGNIEYCMRRSYGHFLDALGTALGSIALFWLIRVLGFITLFWLLLVLQRQVSPFSVCFWYFMRALLDVLGTAQASISLLYGFNTAVGSNGHFWPLLVFFRKLSPSSSCFD